MNLDLQGKTALVSGSTAGIGYAIAQELAGMGALVYVNGRTEERVKGAMAAIKVTHPDARLMSAAADLSTREGAEKIYSAVTSLDILVNNVGGVTAFRPFEQLTDEDWQRVYDFNVMSGVRLTRHYLPAMRASNWGRIVFISSESGIQIPPEFIHYGMAKSAVIAIARGIAESLLASGVTVNSVLPGPTMSEGMAGAAARSGTTEAEFEKQMFEKHRPTSLIRRCTTTQEVASMVAYICSPAASGTHGASLRVEGGVVKSAF